MRNVETIWHTLRHMVSNTMTIKPLPDGDAWPLYFFERRSSNYNSQKLPTGELLLKVYLPDIKKETITLVSNEHNTLAIRWQEEDNNVDFLQNIGIGREYDVSRATAELTGGVLHISIPPVTPDTKTIPIA